MLDNSGSVHSVDDVAYDMIAPILNTRGKIIADLLGNTAAPDVNEAELWECYSDTMLIDAKSCIPLMNLKSLPHYPDRARHGKGALPACGAHLQPAANAVCGQQIPGLAAELETGRAAIDFLVTFRSRRNPRSTFSAQRWRWETVKRIVAMPGGASGSAAKISALP